MKIAKFFPKKTKIVCTIGPASQNQATLEKMITNGMNIARINFAHGDFDAHRQTIANVRTAAKVVGKRVAIFGDLPGPKIRIGKLDQESIELRRNRQARDPFSVATVDYCRLLHLKQLPEIAIFVRQIFPPWQKLIPEVGRNFPRNG